MKISKRLKLIASMCDCENIVDVGCDHALLDIYLTLNNKNCIASDISEKVLINAFKNVEKYNLIDKIKLIQSDGTKNIEIPSNSTLIISGMGAHTIIEILNNTNHSNINELILQSNNNIELLRKEITRLGYYIEKEKSVLDKNKYYVIIKFKKGKKKYSKKDYIIGNLDKDYYNYLLNKNNEIIEKLKFKNFFKKYKLKKVNKWLKQKITK